VLQPVLYQMSDVERDVLFFCLLRNGNVVELHRAKQWLVIAAELTLVPVAAHTLNIKCSSVRHAADIETNRGLANLFAGDACRQVRQIKLDVGIRRRSLHDEERQLPELGIQLTGTERVIAGRRLGEQAS